MSVGPGTADGGDAMRAARVRLPAVRSSSPPMASTGMPQPEISAASASQPSVPAASGWEAVGSTGPATA
jgi:hypothetical protein